MSETFVLDTVARFVGGTEDAELRISNAGTTTIYYDNERTVSSSSNDGSIAAGASADRRLPTWLVATTQTPVTITRKTHPEDSHNVHGFLGDFADLNDLVDIPAADLALKSGDNTFTGDNEFDESVGIKITPFAGVDLHVAGSVNFGNLALSARGATRGLNVIIGRAMLDADLEDIHGALIIGSMSSMQSGSSPGQVFGAEIQAQTDRVAGITPTGDGLIGVNALAVYQSNQTTPWLIGCNGAPQIDDVSSTLAGTATWAVGFRADSVEKLGGATSTVTNAAGMYVREQSVGTNNYGIYLQSTTAAGGRISWAGDTFLSRSAANTLKTDHKLLVGTEVEIDGAFNHDGTTFGALGVTPTTQQATVADASTSHALNATFSDTEVEGALNTLGTKVNSILATLEAFGFHASA